ncbi:LysR family transcriptional regulator [Lacisediminimonas profundi]|uniref:LysR family transcriptional regulator n=1 Tax=Lacisediminimonas profundi TaxID=2603856 RepID=UPI00124B4DC8|nr:LysR family transcriptional regulator [Lacisediminimonas profundi]
MESFDTRLLAVFAGIYDMRSVSRAADDLQLPQPTVSLALAKLRKHYDDQLFVRTSSGMEPTALAQGLIGPVRQVLEGLQSVLSYHDGFDATRSDRRFRICMADISQLVLLPRLWESLRGTAPGVAIDVLPLAADTARLLESGQADLAIGYMPELEAGYFQQLLFHQKFVCMVGASHSRIRSRLTLKQFENEEHAAVSASGPAPWILDREIARHGIKRKVALQLPNYLGAGFVVENTELLVTIPSRLAELLQERGQFRVFPVPFPLPEYDIKQYWHERFHGDRGNQWLRGLISGLLQEAPPARSVRNAS